VTDIVQGEVVGFRGWMVSDDLELIPSYANVPWVLGENVAVCDDDKDVIFPQPPHKAPDPGEDISAEVQELIELELESRDTY
jgi:hypothetical protein